MHRLYFFVALNQPWQLIKTLKRKSWLQRLTQLTAGDSQVTFLATLHLFLTYESTRKPLLGNLIVVDRVFFGRLRPEDIQYCHS